VEFGLATAIAYARAGVSIILLTGRHSDTLQVAKRQVLEAANEAGKVKDVHVEVYVYDVCSEDDIRYLAASVKTTFTKLDVLILNAGKANELIKGADGLMDWPHDTTSMDIPDFRQTFE
jgi:NAD(P)-dependent dehydrogenase (short-subunit alcohol dehydrogenase family)